MRFDSKTEILILIIGAGILLIWYVFRFVGNKKYKKKQLIDQKYIESILKDKVTFFQQLDQAARNKFIDRVSYFLATTMISPEKGAIITDQDRILVAASATIPLFHFDKWSYENLDEVIIYPSTFNERYEIDTMDRLILGMVGDGVMNRKMLISLESLRSGFSNNLSTHNTAIHEFVHLIDKADGEIDGIPSYLIPQELVKPWLKEMHRSIEAIKRNRSDIRDYAATNEAEFLAVVSEYFFQKPKKLEEDHPILYQLLEEIYNRENESVRH
ncbi:zinc-dependent peptidase [Sphingobacterium sp. LRF_L2]|uniref:M90 family metallopeptidase n=1 Tax=Sphingobacterium sp. LRF_L2 TaxID=3369421 RepID=UPI003F5F5B93